MILAIVMLVAVVAGCDQEKGDKPVARGEGFGYDWSAPNRGDLLRVAVQNSFTQTSSAALDGEGHHYELEVGPVREAFMVVPKGTYHYSAWTYGDTVGNTKYEVVKDDRDGFEGILFKIRP